MQEKAHEMQTLQTRNVMIKGKVQGVFFRDYTRKKAMNLNLRGWVRNLQDGSVECTISGNEIDVALMVDWFRKGSPLSRVSDVVVRELPADNSFTSFDILF